MEVEESVRMLRQTTNGDNMDVINEVEDSPCNCKLSANNQSPHNFC